MKMKSTVYMIAALIVTVILAVMPAMAQQVTGVLGSPSATTTVDGRYLPNQPAKFGGEIGLSAKEDRKSVV